MRTLAIATLVSILACAPTTYQHSLQGTSDRAGDELWQAARSALIEMGYGIQDADRGSGILRAERSESTGIGGLGQRIDRLIVSISGDSFQVTAETDWGTVGEAPERTAVSDEAKRDAERLREELSGGA